MRSTPRLRATVRLVRVLLTSTILLLAVGASAVPRGGAAARPDLEVISVAPSHTEVAPDTTLTLTFVLRSTGAPAGAFSVGLYYAPGPAWQSGIPMGAKYLDTYPVSRGLAAGQTVSFSVPVRVPPCEECGPHTVYVAADVGNLVAESIEVNNVRAVTLDVAENHLPDLRVMNVVLTPDRGSTSDALTVRGTVKNASHFFAHGPFRVSVYCSPDSEITRFDKKLYSFVVPSLGADQSVGVDRPIHLEPGCGVHALSTWVGLLADDKDAVRESNEQNDDASAPFWVFRAPDLGSHPVDVSAMSAPAGARVSVSYRIDNEGGSAAGPFKTGVYFTKDAKQLVRGTLLDTATVPSLGANTQSGIFQHAIVVPSVPRGRYFLGVSVDIDGANGELRKRNKFDAVPFDVTDTNLTDVFFSARQKEVQPGGAVLLRLAVQNTGIDPAAPSHIGLYYSDDPRFDRERDVKLGRLDVGKLDRHGARALNSEREVSVTIPKDAREGYRFLLAVLDEDDEVRETDEHDNVALEPVRITVP